MSVEKDILEMDKKITALDVKLDRQTDNIHLKLDHMIQLQRYHNETQQKQIDSHHEALFDKAEGVVKKQQEHDGVISFVKWALPLTLTLVGLLFAYLSLKK